MSLDLNGKVIKILPLQQGESKAGKAWQKQEFVIETADKFPKQVCFSTMNDKTDEVKKLKVGDVVTVSFDPESREYNSKWYTDLRAWKISSAQSSGSAPKGDTPPPFTDADIPPAEEEDLPF